MKLRYIMNVYGLSSVRFSSLNNSSSLYNLAAVFRVSVMLPPLLSACFMISVKCVEYLLSSFLVVMFSASSMFSPSLILVSVNVSVSLSGVLLSVADLSMDSMIVNPAFVPSASSESISGISLSIACILLCLSRLIIDGGVIIMSIPSPIVRYTHLFVGMPLMRLSSLVSSVYKIMIVPIIVDVVESIRYFFFVYFVIVFSVMFFMFYTSESIVSAIMIIAIAPSGIIMKSNIVMSNSGGIPAIVPPSISIRDSIMIRIEGKTIISDTYSSPIMPSELVSRFKRSLFSSSNLVVSLSR